MTAREAAISRAAAWAAAATDCSIAAQGAGIRRERPVLLFLSGRVWRSGAWYSQGVRQELWSLINRSAHAQNGGGEGIDSWDGVVFRQGKWSIDQLRQAQFCLCPSGWGFGWRTYLAVATLCIPVIVQPLVPQVTLTLHLGHTYIYLRHTLHPL